ncbi:hypothetical protein HMPREF9577_01585 [Cutibacterium acnes HL110PA3]|nr:hypothetical protein HMPREF9577_01585 [Cutibacterium acnes HL110PA3]
MRSLGRTREAIDPDAMWICALGDSFQRESSGWSSIGGLGEKSLGRSHSAGLRT